MSDNQLGVRRDKSRLYGGFTIASPPQLPTDRRATGLFRDWLTGRGLLNG